MDFNNENEVIRICAQGMEFEGKGETTSAVNLFEKAWAIASTDFEKFTAAHYVARHQSTILQKLNWDETALKHALLIGEDNVKSVLPSLYLNIGKCYEDLNDPINAKMYYEKAFFFAEYPPENEYGCMIKSGIVRGMERIKLLNKGDKNL